MKRSILAVVLALGATAGCQKADKAAPKSEPAADKASDAGAGLSRPNPGAPDVKPSLPVATPPADATKTASGLVYKTLKEGTGPSPGQNDKVTIHYTGWRTTGETFYTTQNKGEPVPTDLWNVAPGFSEALTLMKQGGKSMF